MPTSQLLLKRKTVYLAHQMLELHFLPHS
uniref:Uncharacterized protein n=1 Tax=Lepeophtheirus salmonis TaxID=72036 RepID=A0A0K2VEA5_LEPSM